MLTLGPLADAIDKASLPSLLVSCKCDIDPSQRQLDPSGVEQRAKSVLRKINTLQVSNTSVDAQSQSVVNMIRAVCAANIGTFFTSENLPIGLCTTACCSCCLCPPTVAFIPPCLLVVAWELTVLTSIQPPKIQLPPVDVPCHLVLNLDRVVQYHIWHMQEQAPNIL
jgi:hypothetical protein